MIRSTRICSISSPSLKSSASCPFRSLSNEWLVN
jgi:hypothetical protein